MTKKIFDLKDFNANGGCQSTYPPVSKSYNRVPHKQSEIPNPLLPPLEFSENFKGWVLAHDEQYIIEDVTPQMMDWFWANIEKCFQLWAPGDHNWMTWLKAPAQVGFVGSQTIGTSLMIPGGPCGGVKNTRMDMDSYPFTTCLDHCVIEFSEVGDEIHEGKCNSLGVDAYYISSWSAHDKGIIWRSSVAVKPDGMHITDLWDESKHSDAPIMSTESSPINVSEQDMSGNPQSAHGVYEIARFSQFLPELYRLWKVVPDPGSNVPNDLRVGKNETGEWIYLNPYKPE